MHAGPKPFDLPGERLTHNKRWEQWLERFRVDPRDRDNSQVYQMALLIYSGTAGEDLHESLADMGKPAEIKVQTGLTIMNQKCS